MVSAQMALQRVFRQLSQSIVCSKRHSVDQQLVRWILTTLDRTPSDTITVTHQELSELLGFRREAVTLAMGRFHETGYIASCRGLLTVLDRSRLEEAVCDCYWTSLEKAQTPGSQT